ncbi:MAG TPA: NRDE family protein [Candidatus Binataceae bacterium]|nr:NRDE family protein [Candidatus Binataceae bacterium]
MCTLAIYFRAVEKYPVIIAANRDEFLDRPAEPPGTLLEHPHVIGGIDLRAGGTWLGINEHGVAAGLLNRRVEGAATPNARSRGLLCLDALRCRTANEAANFASRQNAADYNPFNLLVASREEAFVASRRRDKIEVLPLAPGLHLITNLDVNDPECPKIAAAYGKFARLLEDSEFQRDPVAQRDALSELLADHNTQLDPRSGRPNALCLHLNGYGTRSSSLIFMSGDAGPISHFFAPGPPCQTGYSPAPVPHGQDSK